MASGSSRASCLLRVGTVESRVDECKTRKRGAFWYLAFRDRSMRSWPPDDHRQSLLIALGIH